MQYILLRPIFLACALSVSGLVFAAPPAEKPAQSKPIPSFAKIQQSVEEYFKEIPNFRKNDLITRDMVEPLLKQLQKLGLPLADASQIVEKVPSKDEFLAVQLSTNQGRQFMRSISKYPDGYDRVDRLSRMPHGEQTVRDLIRGPDGYKMIEYMTTAKGGRALGDQLSNSPTGKNFNAPTGRLYTVSLLLARLQQSHAAAMKAAEKKKGP